MKTLTRRSFLKQSALGAGVLGLSARSWAQVPGANDDIRLAVVGFNGRGKEHIKEWTSIKGVRLTALCDADTKVIDAAVGQLGQKNITVETYQDIRKLLASKNVDAISIATPNHWHALASVWGMQAGKDVYVEKPVCFDLWEGRQMLEAARRYNKIVQAGTQSRSSYGIRQAVEFVQKGNLGKIRLSRGLCYKERLTLGQTEGPQEIPSTVDYDLWCGPAPLTPPRRRKFHYDWHWFWNYGAGDIGNQGIHEMDVARWFLGEKALSPSIMTVGGRLGYTDDAETPNTFIAFHDYPTAPLIMEVRGLHQKADVKAMDKLKGVDIGIIVECEGGYVRVPNYNEAYVVDNDGKEIQHFKGSDNHFENFIKAVRSRKESELNAPLREGYLSTALCHTANISYRLGSQASPDAIREQIKADRDGLATFQRMIEHLAANNVDLAKTPATLGAVLKMNPSTEEFVESPKASEFLKRAPREPYVIRVA